ncbi:nacht wd40 domain-containing protein, partial [Moniliophthora roreri]
MQNSNSLNGTIGGIAVCMNTTALTVVQLSDSRAYRFLEGVQDFLVYLRSRSHPDEYRYIDIFDPICNDLFC